MVFVWYKSRIILKVRCELVLGWGGVMGKNGEIRGLIEPNSPRNSSPFFPIMILNFGIQVNY